MGGSLEIGIAVSRIALAPALASASDSASRHVPARALWISLAAMSIPVAVVFAFPDWTATGFGTLIWLSALIPAFLLAYYRGLRGVAVALAGGMAVITATQVSVAAFGISEPNWSLLLAIVTVYLVVSVGIAVLAEALRRERSSAEDLALVDRLTGLPNRRRLDIALESSFAAAVRGNPMTVVMFDLDHFKRVNDVHGHAKGDEVLREFAEVLHVNTRKADLTARYGGEEFMTVLADADETAAGIFAERVLDGVRRLVFPWGKQTVSAGIATYQPAMDSFDVLVVAADQALYEAKAAGRDRAVVAPRLDRAGAAVALTPVGDLASALPAAKSRGRVFVIDDNSDLRETIRITLTEHGFDVWDSGDPKEAIRHFVALPDTDRPGVIITDVIMPDMTGMTMIEHIERAAPGQRVLYMSGYVHDPIPPDATPGAVVAFIEKPFGLETLVSKVAELMPIAGVEVPGPC
jgi:diguanylate cyclase (GGDEF)-like protein